MADGEGVDLTSWPCLVTSCLCIVTLVLSLMASYNMGWYHQERGSEPYFNNATLLWMASILASAMVAIIKFVE